MKKVLTIAGITICLLSTNKASAQTVVCAGGKTITLTADNIEYLHRFQSPGIESLLKTSTSIKYNSTADLIVFLITHRKSILKDSLFLTKLKGVKI